MTKVFIDGKAGTTGLRIYERLEARQDIELLTLSEEERKNPEARSAMLNSCEVAFLCLPDDAAREAVSMVKNPDTVIIDTSTAHRTEAGWAYGFPELSPEHEQRVREGRRIAVPGCYAGGFIALVYPLITQGIISSSALLSCHAVSGYSGAGKKGIAQYEDKNRSTLLDAPRQYALGQSHKHLKEMKSISGLENAPIFSPLICDYYSGMVMTVPVFADSLCAGKTAEDIRAAYAACYNTDIVKYMESMDEDGFLSGAALSGKDCMEITVCGNDERILLVARYDNLGKGASGAAVECLNLVIGANKSCGLVL